MVHLAELARLEQLARAAHGRHEAVVERAHVHHAGLGHGVEHLARLRGVERQRLLADHVLAGARGRDHRLGVKVVREQVLEHLHLGVGHHLPPVRHVAGDAEALGELAALRLVAAGHRHEPRRDRGRARHVTQRDQGVGVGPAHERVAEQPYARRLHTHKLSTARRSRR